MRQLNQTKDYIKDIDSTKNFSTANRREGGGLFSSQQWIRAIALPRPDQTSFTIKDK